LFTHSSMDIHWLFFHLQPKEAPVFPSRITKTASYQSSHFITGGANGITTETEGHRVSPGMTVGPRENVIVLCGELVMNSCPAWVLPLMARMRAFLFKKALLGRFCHSSLAPMSSLLPLYWERGTS
jgi:hypothetical protein